MAKTEASQARELMEARRRALEREHGTHEPQFYILVTETQARELMAGRVPELVGDMARTMVDWTLETGPLDYVGRRTARQ